MPQQKPPDLDEQGNPVSTQPPDLDEYGYPIESKPPSMWDNPTWRALTTPPEFISRGVKQFGDWLTTPELDDWKATAMAKGFVAGATEGASQFLNPLDVAGMATGVGEYNAARRGLSTIANALKWGERATSAPIMAHGFERITDPNASLGEKGAGIAELAGGALGTFGPPTPVRPRPGAVALASEAATALPEPISAPPPPPPATRQGNLPFAEPQARNRPPSIEGQGILPLDYSEPIPPIKPPINQTVAEAVVKPPVAETMLDVEGKGGLEADLTTMEGIQKAYAEGKIDRETALRNAAKVHRKLLVKPEPPQETAKAVFDEEEVVIDPNTGEIISEKPYPLTEEPAAGVTPPAGVDEVARMVMNGEVKNVAELQKKLGVSFNKTKTIWYEAKEKIKAIREAESTVPAVAKQAPELSQSTLKVPRGQANKEYIGGLREQGYEFQGLDDEGNYIFGVAESSAKEAPGFESKFKGATDEALASEATPFDARMTSIEGIQAAFREGKISQEEALTRMQEIIRKNANINIEKMEESPFGERGWSEDTSQSRMTPEEIEIWNEMRGVQRTSEEPPILPKKRWELEREFAGPFAKASEPSIFPEAARASGGKVKIGADVRSLGKVLGSSLYSGDISKIATKELLQNSLDAIGPAGAKMGPRGVIDIELSNSDKTISVIDNGKGLTRQEVETIFTDLGASGKRDIEDAIGGFGLAKAAPLLGGEHVEVATIARNPKDGKLHQIKFEGTPDELLSGVVIDDTIMPEGTPTGTGVKVKVGKGDFYGAENLVKNVAQYSDIEGKIYVKQYGSRREVTNMTLGNAKPVTTIDTPVASVDLAIPPNATIGEHSRLKLVLKNNGMYQSSEDMWFHGKLSGIPDVVTVNIKSKVKEGHTDYPFTANREQLRGTVDSEVRKYINENVIKPAKDKYSQGVQDLYDGMLTVTTKHGNQLFFHDTGAKMSKLEMRIMTESPVIQRIGEQIDTILKQTLSVMNQPSWTSRLAKTGIIFDDKLRGIHIPNPGGGTSAILVNPLGLMAKRTPDEAAAGLLHTTLHEAAHIEPLDSGHGENFCIRLGDIYEKFGASRALYQQKLTREILTDGSGNYTPEIQNLLRIYRESRGRSTVEDDILTRTGSGQRFESSGERGFSPGSKPTGNRTLREFPIGGVIVVNPKQASPEVVKRLYQEGFRFVDESPQGGLRFRKDTEPGAGPVLEEEVGGQRPTKRAIRGQLGPIQDAQKSSAIMEAFNFPRGVMASWDLSAPLRQGLPMIHKKEFWTAFEPMMKSWASEEGFQAAQDAIASRALFKKRPNSLTGKLDPSFADDAGLKLTDLVDLSSREEAIMSTWAEKVPGVRRSNRAYTAFLNNLRADVFESLIKDAGVLGGDPKKNLPLARAIAEYVNTATGRGSLGKLEASATILNTTLFAPRLIASRIRMLNPATYIMAPPRVRKEYTKSLLALAGFGSTILGLAKMGGAEVSMDPTSSDFMKAKIGDKVRLDPWGGFQQYAVLFSRLISGKVTSSTSGKEYEMINTKPGPFDPSHMDTLMRFTRGKTNPVVNFTWGLLDFQREMSGKPMQFSTPNPFENSVTQRFIPIFIQDIYQIAQESPELLPLLGPAAGLGMGVQVYDNPR